MQLRVHRKGVNRTKGTVKKESSFEGKSPGGMLLAGVKVKNTPQEMCGEYRAPEPRTN